MKTPSSSLDQVKTIFGFINRLQFKDEIAADAAETTESAMESANYIAACLRSDTNTEEVRKIIIDSYVEKNKYYKALLDDYGVNPFVARMTKDLDIVYQDINLISRNKFLEYYREVYKESLVFFYTTSYTKAYLSDSNYRNFCLMTINMMAFLKLIGKFLEDPYDLEIMPVDVLDSFLNSFGIPFFRHIPYRYKKIIAKNLNSLVTKKGTDQVILDILEIFGFKDIDVFTYYLVKTQDYTDGLGLKNERVVNPRFFSHSLKEDSLHSAIKKGVHRVHDFNTIVEKDPHWIASKEEVASVDFDYVESKYFSIETGFDLSREAIASVYLLNLIRQIRIEYPSSDMMQLDVPQLSTNKLFLEDLIVLLQVITLEYYGMEDIVPSGGAIDYMYQFKDHEDVDTISLTDELYPGHEGKMYLGDMRSTGTFSMANTLVVYDRNEEIRKHMEEEIATETNHERLNKLRDLYRIKFIQSATNDVFSDFKTYTDYLRSKDISLGYYLDTIRAYTDEDIKKQRLQDDIVTFTDLIKEYVDESNNRENELILGTNTITIISSYIRQVIEVFKAFTVTLQNLDIFIIINEKMSHRVVDYMGENAFMKIGLEFGQLWLTDQPIFNNRRNLEDINKKGDIHQYAKDTFYFSNEDEKMKYDEAYIRNLVDYLEDKGFKDDILASCTVEIQEFNSLLAEKIEYRMVRDLVSDRLITDETVTNGFSQFGEMKGYTDNILPSSVVFSMEEQLVNFEDQFELLSKYSLDQDDERKLYDVSTFNSTLFLLGDKTISDGITNTQASTYAVSSRFIHSDRIIIRQV